MARRVEGSEDLPKGLEYSRYLYFNTVPPQLWIGVKVSEAYEEILTASELIRTQIQLAGDMRRVPDQQIYEVRGTGCYSLDVAANNPALVIGFIKTLGVDAVEGR